MKMRLPSSHAAFLMIMVGVEAFQDSKLFSLLVSLDVFGLYAALKI